MIKGLNWGIWTKSLKIRKFKSRKKNNSVKFPEGTQLFGE
jgi:hypothetical protein